MSAPRQTGNQLAPVRQMQRCGQCESELVQPVAWKESFGSSWQVELRCPECEWHGSGVYSQREIDGYDRFLDDGAHALVADLRQLTRENMTVETNAFAAALEAGLILPEDF
jgi:hypothetical protein